MPKAAAAQASRARTPSIRRATAADLPAIQALEKECFQDYRQASAASLRRSLDSKRQSVWVVDAETPHGAGGAGARAGRKGPASQQGPQLWALLVLWHHPKRLRVYDIATHPDARGRGLGSALMAHAQAQARKAGATFLTLEAEELDPRLVGWYEQQGFLRVARLPDYYHEGCGAIRLVRPVGPAKAPPVSGMTTPAARPGRRGPARGGQPRGA